MQELSTSEPPAKRPRQEEPQTQDATFQFGSKIKPPGQPKNMENRSVKDTRNLDSTAPHITIYNHGTLNIRTG
jgi:hypothetical protein